MSGRPLRFVGVATIGWVGMRALMLWPGAGPAAIPRALVPAALAEDATPVSGGVPTPVAKVIAAAWEPQAVAGVVRLRGVTRKSAAAGLAPSVAAAQSPGLPTIPGASTPPQTILGPPSPVSAATVPQASRWSASAWFVLRDGQGIAPGLNGGQLGGSQAGVRVAYAIGEARRVAIAGRLASPLKGIGREAAMGIEWRPTALPVRLVAEYRIALDSGTSGPAAGVVAGTGPAPIALGFDLETYGQAGIVRRRRAEPFAEGAARLSRRVVSLGGAKLDLGLGSWGGAQRGVRRLDVGPSLGVRIPVAGKAIRASLDCGIM
jgi:hypothetical protein